jgi:hypothetical protein
VRASHETSGEHLPSRAFGHRRILADLNGGGFMIQLRTEVVETEEALVRPIR